MARTTESSSINKKTLIEKEAFVLDLFEASNQLRALGEAVEQTLGAEIGRSGFDTYEIVEAAYRRPVNQKKIDQILKAFLPKKRRFS